MLPLFYTNNKDNLVRHHKVVDRTINITQAARRKRVKEKSSRSSIKAWMARLWNKE